MLKGLFYIFLGIMLACSCNSKSKKQNEQEVNTPTSVNDSNTIAKIEFPQKSFNFGDLQEGEIVTHTFRFKNTGTKSLVILNVEASCGCTTPKYDKKPIPPGGEGKIEVEFNSSGRYGKQYKVINIFANVPEKVIELKIIANIIENGTWNTEGTAECANDCKLIIDERTYYYHSECGTFNDKENNQNLPVTTKEKESINVILAHYITLGLE